MLQVGGKARHEGMDKKREMKGNWLFNCVVIIMIMMV